MKRVTIEELEGDRAALFAERIACKRPYRGRQRPRDRDEVLVLIELAQAAWARAEASGSLRWDERGRLHVRGAPPE